MIGALVSASISLRSRESSSSIGAAPRWQHRTQAKPDRAPLVLSSCRWCDGQQWRAERRSDLVVVGALGSILTRSAPAPILTCSAQGHTHARTRRSDDRSNHAGSRRLDALGHVGWRCRRQRRGRSSSRAFLNALVEQRLPCLMVCELTTAIAPFGCHETIAIIRYSCLLYWHAHPETARRPGMGMPS